MKSVRLHAIRTLQLHDAHRSGIHKEEKLIRVKAVGICLNIENILSKSWKMTASEREFVLS